MNYPWQETQWSKLSEVLRQGRLPHALMLSGTAGTGKREFASVLANLVLCDQAIVNGSEEHSARYRPCGECKSCKLIQAEAHPDIRYFEPEEKSSVVKVDQIRELNDYIAKSSQQGAFKVAIIHPAEAMNVNAANALLKSLEEPSRKTLIILVVDQPGRMLATIRSRCQVIEFPLPSRDQSRDWLQQALPENQHIDELLELSAGSPIKALQLADSEAVSQKQAMIGDLAQVLKRQATVVSVATQWQKYELKIVLDWNLLWAQQLVRYSMTTDESLIGDERLLRMIQYLSKKHTASTFYRLLDKIHACSDLVARNTNPNHQVLIENLLVAWSELMQKNAA